ncbi:MAG: hypothetical protein H7Z42_13910 [Roseiflexaceae bacterium]|nr:hypothetical protein [Roseiflexaceae bacterium]
MNIRLPLALTLLALLLFTLVGCGNSAPATLAVIPIYTDATELKPGESAVADTLVENMKQNQALTGQLGVNATIEQKAFTMPAGATWDDVKKFYDENLTSSGWSSNSMISNVMAQTNAANDQFQLANWQKNKQNLSVIMIADPTNEGAKMLIVSLASA